MKTAGELVDELIANTFPGSPTNSHAKAIKAALGRERANTIQMRPISELPDKVPDDMWMCLCGPHSCILGWSDDEVGTFPARYPTSTHFCLIPKPVAPRKLHACYMPGCGASPVVYDVSPTKDKPRWVVTCDKCNTVGPVKPTKEEAEEAWGWEE